MPSGDENAPEEGAGERSASVGAEGSGGTRAHDATKRRDAAASRPAAFAQSPAADPSELAAARPLDALRELMRRLRDPRDGCAWDVAQSFATIAPYTIEEAYEVADAIERGDLEDLRDELGDLLLQVVFHARMAEEAGAFDLDDVARAIVAKMVRRHPHVFGDARFVSDAERSANWEAQKARERAAKAARGDSDAGTAPSVLDGVAGALPALVRADKLQRRAARVGFDWPDAAPVGEKLDEEIAEVAEAVARADADALEDELGDLLFTAVNLARHHRVDPEAALRRANAKFERRFRALERLAAADGVALDTLELAGLDALWARAKAEVG